MKMPKTPTYRTENAAHFDPEDIAHLVQDPACAITLEVQTVSKADVTHGVNLRNGKESAARQLLPIEKRSQTKKKPN